MSEAFLQVNMIFCFLYSTYMMRGNMGFRSWKQLPPDMRNKKTKYYYSILSQKKIEFVIIRFADIVLAMFLLIVFFLPGVVISVLIVMDSSGSPIFLQERIKQYGEPFYIIKFRTMRARKEDERDNLVGTTERITKVGKILRKYRLDEIPQLINILIGDMTFVGTRPEVERFVRQYTEEMFATLLLPPGLTSNTSIVFKDEEKLLAGAKDFELEYIERILPEKMKYNLEETLNIGILYNIGILFKTVKAVLC